MTLLAIYVLICQARHARGSWSMTHGRRATCVSAATPILRDMAPQRISRGCRLAMNGWSLRGSFGLPSKGTQSSPNDPANNLLSPPSPDSRSCRDPAGEDSRANAGRFPQEPCNAGILEWHSALPPVTPALDLQCPFERVDAPQLQFRGIAGYAACSACIADPQMPRHCRCPAILNSPAMTPAIPAPLVSIAPGQPNTGAHGQHLVECVCPTCRIQSRNAGRGEDQRTFSAVRSPHGYARERDCDREPEMRVGCPWRMLGPQWGLVGMIRGGDHESCTQ